MRTRYLKQEIVDELRDQVEDHLEIYRSGKFDFLESDTSKYIEGFCQFDETKLRTLKLPDADGNYEQQNCVICFKALSKFTAYEARDERLWAYLTHTLLLEYTRRRWSIPSNKDAAIAHVKKHFFARDKRQIERDNAASRLWWMARLCERVPTLPLKDCLEVLLFRADVRANIIERPTASQSPALFSAIMKKLHTSFKGEQKLFDRTIFRPFMIKLNSIGGVMLLDCINEQQLTTIINGIIKNDCGLQTL